jgi:hypothetical protein
MKIFLRAFNDSINSKTGISIPDSAPRRGTPEWKEFEVLVIDALRKLGHEVEVHLEHPKETPDYKKGFDKSIHVHRSKREVPDGDLFYMQMHLRDLFTLDRNGWGFDHSDNDCGFLESSTIATEFVTNLSDTLWANKISKCEQSEQTICDAQYPFILVTLQIPRDYTLLYHSPITVRYFLDSIQAWAHQSQTHVAFKLHPHNKCDHDLIYTIEDAIQNSRYCHKAEGNIHEIIKRSSGVFTINSGTGFESLIHGKPVCTFGSCDYNRVTFNADIRRLDEARNFIFDFDEEKQKIGYAYVHWYMTEHGFYLKDPQINKKLEGYLSQWTKN